MRPLWELTRRRAPPQFAGNVTGLSTRDCTHVAPRAKVGRRHAEGPTARLATDSSARGDRCVVAHSTRRGGEGERVGTYHGSRAGCHVSSVHPPLIASSTSHVAPTHDHHHFHQWTRESRSIRTTSPPSDRCHRPCVAPIRVGHRGVAPSRRKSSWRRARRPRTPIAPSRVTARETGYRPM